MCNSSANCCVAKSDGCWLEYFTFNNRFICTCYSTIEGSLCWYQLYFGFSAILNALSHGTLSEAVLLVKSLKYPWAMSCWRQALSSPFCWMYFESPLSLNFCILSC